MRGFDDVMCANKRLGAADPQLRPSPFTFVHIRQESLKWRFTLRLL